MTKKLLLPIFVVALATLAACSSKKSASGTVAAAALTQADADRAAAKFPGATLASLNDGKNHYENNCGKCHKLHAPADFSEEKWKKVVPPMSGKANVDKNTENLILQYVVTLSVK
jgi:cytochrome c5